MITKSNINRLQVKMTKLHPDAVMPSYAKDGDAAMDLYASEVLKDQYANYVYLINKNTDPTHYVIVSLYDVVVGRLYAGDWMFMPWDSDVVAVGAGGSAIEIQAYEAEATIEYCLFHNGETKLTSDDS